MKKIITTLTIGFALIALAGCTTDSNSTPEKGNASKIEKGAKKCASGKCSSGKCGSNKQP